MGHYMEECVAVNGELEIVIEGEVRQIVPLFVSWVFVVFVMCVCVCVCV